MFFLKLREITHEINKLKDQDSKWRENLWQFETHFSLPFAEVVYILKKINVFMLMHSHNFFSVIL